MLNFINTLLLSLFQVLAPSGQDAIAEDMKVFADQLRPLVLLEKIDYKRLGHIPWAHILNRLFNLNIFACIILKILYRYVL